MNRSRNIHNELETLREKFTDLFSATEPAKEFGATMVLAMLRLHMVEARIRKTHNYKERRRLIDEFTSGKITIEKGLQAFEERSFKSHIPAPQDQREAMPRLQRMASA
ncbi:conserved hypothetical protein [delta proteobacterium NaphS2]|nr:conserved hypothetical protein [delta proteobacterium NaphS2]